MTMHISISQRARDAVADVEWDLNFPAHVDMIQPTTCDSRFSDELFCIGIEIFQLWVFLGNGPLIVKWAD